MKIRTRLINSARLGLTTIVLAGLLGILPPAGTAMTYNARAAFGAQAMVYQNVVIVAKSGGDYTSIQAAIDSITDASADNAYLVWVAPGVYEEQVTIKSYVHLQGAGQEATVITSAITNESLPPDKATLMLAGNTSLRDLTVGNSGTGSHNVALLAATGTAKTLVADVTVRAQGDGTHHNNYAIYLAGGDTGVTLQHVTALGENGDSNYGLYSTDGAEVVLHGGSFTGCEGSYAYGIYNYGSGTTLEAEGVAALGEGGHRYSSGLFNAARAEAVLHGGSFTGLGGSSNYGIYNDGGTRLKAEDVTTLGEGGIDNYGLYCLGGEVILRGGSFTGLGGGYTYGIYNNDGARLKAESVTALGEGGIDNYGLCNPGGEATLHGGSFTGRGGIKTHGIYQDGGAKLEATSVTALGESASDDNLGLCNNGGAKAVLYGGSFTGRGGNISHGIYNYGSDTRLEAEGATALGEDSSDNYGLSNSVGAEAVLHGGFFIGRGGKQAYGISNYTAMLETTSVAALGEGGIDNYGLYNVNGAKAVLHGGSFTGRGGDRTYGIYNTDGGTRLEATGVTALGEDGNNYDYGLYNVTRARAVLRGGSFTGHGGFQAYGIYNNGTDTKLEAKGVTALGEDASYNYGLRNEFYATVEADSSQFIGSNRGLSMNNGTVRLGVTQLDGGADAGTGTLLCFQVYDGSYASYDCP